MTFKDFKYERPDMDALSSAFKEALDAFENAKDPDAQEQALDEINALRRRFNTMKTLAHIRHSIDTKDAFYEKEKQFFDENGPLFSSLNHRFYQALSRASFKESLKERKGNLLFQKAEQSLKTFSDDIVEDLQRENSLASEHNKILAGAEIEFNGGTYNLSEMAPFTQSPERDTRRRASKAVSEFFTSQEETLDKLYDDLVNVRVKIAEKLGYDSFIPLAYNRLGRSDYGPEDVKAFRERVKRYIVPLSEKLAKQKQKRLGLKAMKHYDHALEFKSGNPTPKKDSDALLDEADRMYEDMSEETDHFFSFMREKGLMDLKTKKGKAGGGFCTFIPDYRAPFIFANFNGTKHDVDVLTHEAGHAFQMFMSRDKDVPEYLSSSPDIMEIHSMSMEFFAWPYAERFFGEDTEKYKFAHLSSALRLIAYGAAIDEFQHDVFEDPGMTPEARKALWREKERTYMPYIDYEDDPFLERGGQWHKIMHIFVIPFYMIDYTLAQTCAFQYLIRRLEDSQKAWESYLELCKAGGERPFKALLKLAGLKSPFEGALEETIPSIEDMLEKIDDTL